MRLIRNTIARLKREPTFAVIFVLMLAAWRLNDEHKPHPDC
jgi:hypothetical protein